MKSLQINVLFSKHLPPSIMADQRKGFERLCDNVGEIYSEL